MTIVDTDLSLAQLEQRSKDLKPDGLRPISLSMYGDPAAPLFSAVWVERPGLPWQWRLARPAAELASGTAADLHPILVAGTGGGAQTRISVVFAKRQVLGRGAPNELTVDQDLQAFAQEVFNRGKDGWLLRSAALHGDPGDLRVSAVWVWNTDNVAWSVFVPLSPAQHEEILAVQTGIWFRLAFLTGSASGELLALYRDDQLGPIGQGSTARHGLTLAELEKARQHLSRKRFSIQSLQGYGPPSARRYAAVFAGQGTPVPREARATGGPEVPGIDQAVFKLMKLSNIRGASLAIVKDSRLVLARGYTWAEPDYPAVEPTTCFRMGSVSKLIGAVALHQLVAEGLLDPTAQLPDVLPLSRPDGSPPKNAAYENATVRSLLEKIADPAEEYFPPHYSGHQDNFDVLAAFPGAQLPVTIAQITSFWLTKALVNGTGILSNFGYLLAGELVRQLRGAPSLDAAVVSRLTHPLQITRLRSARSLLASQLPDEARYHPRETLTLLPPRSVMDPAQPFVGLDYGDENLENLTVAGGLSGAAPDVARVLAALSLRPYTPLGRPAADTLLAAAAQAGGHGFDGTLDQLIPLDRGYFKGGLLQTAQAGLWFTEGDLSYVLLWNGRHTGHGLVFTGQHDSLWYPFFTEMVTAARSHEWPGTDLFPGFGMASLPRVQNGWRRCGKCRSLFHAEGGPGVCPAGGGHDPAGSFDYRIMRRSGRQSIPPEPELPYGQAGWRRCRKCRVLFHAGPGLLSFCAGGGGHEEEVQNAYRLLVDSPYEEHEGGWRRCARCRALVLPGPNPGVCPFGGDHSLTGSGGSGEYRLAGS
jgi:CubicO group peptidase (beta-lactamase class C family)